MKESSKEKENSSYNVAAELRIVSDNDGKISFFCDWLKDEVSISYLANILSVLDTAGLAEAIIKELKSGASSQQDIDEIDRIYMYCSAIKALKKQTQNIDENEVVISPIDAISLI